MSANKVEINPDRLKNIARGGYQDDVIAAEFDLLPEEFDEMLEKDATLSRCYEIGRSLYRKDLFDELRNSGNDDFKAVLAKMAYGEDLFGDIIKGGGLKAPKNKQARNTEAKVVDVLKKLSGRG